MIPSALLLALATLSPANATSTGRTGSTTAGCSCHGSASAATVVTITPSSTTVTPGGTVTLSVRVENSTKTGAGFNAGVVDAAGSNAGTLSAGTGSKVSGGEATHTARQTMTSGAYTFTFNWTAPSTPGTYRVRAAGNAVNSNGTTSGDAWALATTVELTVCAADGDGDGVTVCGGDCNDANNTIFPGATEVVGDGVDQTCDGAETCFVDADNDGYRLTSTVASADADCADSGEALASEPTGDCNDSSSSIKPGATELPGDLVDQNCDGAELCYVDADNDGYRLTSTITSADADCADSGEAAASEPTGDCNDASAAIRPGATETCDGVDQDCDGLVDDGAPGGTFWYLDVDTDGYGDPATQITSCTTPVGYITAGGDCDDTRVAINPAASEVCDAADLDEDCDGLADDADPSASGKLPWFVDGDGDTYGDAPAGSFCDAPSGAVRSDTDCDDGDAAVYPSAPESCADAVDYNCDGVVSRVDLDSDGWAACEECDDTNRDVNPDATEVCNGVDDDCNGVVDGAEAADAGTFYVDSDSDGYGDPARAVNDCSAPEGTSPSDADCDDSDPLASPEGVEVWYDGVDQDCDGRDDDQDGDGALLADDCDDTDPDLIEDCGEDTGVDGGDEGATDGGDGAADGADGAGDGGEAAAGDDGAPSDEDAGSKDPVGCASAPASGLGLGLMGGLLALLGLRRRR